MMTIVYYTGHTGEPFFEQKIREELLKSSKGMKIVSVSQKPLDFGENICVGDVGKSHFNAWKQMKIGVENAKTKFVCMAEDDTLYPEEYFEFVPPREDYLYVPKQCYVLFLGRKKSHSYFGRKQGSEGTIIAGRDFLLRRLDKMYKGLDEWRTSDTLRLVLFKRNWTTFDLKTPVVVFKPKGNLHMKAPIRRGERLRSLPYWGDSINLSKRFTS